MEVPHMNLYSFVVSNPNATPDSFILLTDAITKRSFTFGEWKRDTRRWAAGLQSIGFKRGDVMAMFTFNQVDYSVVMFGPLLLGGTTTTANSAYTVDELTYQLTDSGATVLVTHPELLATALESLSTLESQLPQPLALTRQEAAETTAFICYSSGTTGRSKGVELSHVNLCINALQISASDAAHPRNENITLCVLPMYHLYSLIYHLVIGMYTGVPTIVIQKFNIEDFLRAIEEYK
ncbi:hypothetical protein BG004_003861, partial [Podila humilis]